MATAAKGAVGPTHSDGEFEWGRRTSDESAIDAAILSISRARHLTPRIETIRPGIPARDANISIHDA